MASIQTKYRTSLRSAVIPLTNCLALQESVRNAPLNWCDGTARLMWSLRSVSFKLRRRCFNLSVDRDDGCESAAALVRRSGTDMGFGFGIEPCAHLALNQLADRLAKNT